MLHVESLLSQLGLLCQLLLSLTCHLKCVVLLKMLQQDDEIIFPLFYSLFFSVEHSQSHLTPHPSPSHQRPQITPCMNMSTFVVCAKERISMILPVCFIQTQPAFVCTQTHTHADTHHPHRGKPKHSRATNINWDFMNLISFGYTCILHGLLPIHLKSNQTKKYIPPVELALTRGFATTS